MVELKIIYDLHKLIAEKTLDLLVFLVELIVRKEQLSTLRLSFLGKVDREVLVMESRSYCIITIFLKSLFYKAEFI